MKNATVYFLPFFLFFTNIIFAQKLELDLTLKSNYLFLDIEDDLPRTPLSDLPSSTGFVSINNKTTIYRHAQGKLGLEFGVRAKYNWSRKWSVISGVEARFLYFERYSEVAEDYSRIQTSGLIDLSDIFIIDTTGTLPVINEDSTTPSIINSQFNSNKGLYQKLLYLNIPINIGYTTPSERWTFYGGIWYSFLLQSDYEKHQRRFKSNDAFKRHVIGLNIGVESKLSRYLGITLSYSGVATNLYSYYDPYLDKSDYSNFFGNVADPFPASKNFHLLSLGLTYQIFSK